MRKNKTEPFIEREFCLSDKFINSDKIIRADKLSKEKLGCGINAELLMIGDVKEFINKIINVIEKYNDSSFMLSPIIAEIEKLAGDKLL